MNLFVCNQCSVEGGPGLITLTSRKNDRIVMDSLAPTVAQKIISLFDGEVSVRNLEPPGIAFETNLKLG